MRCFAPFCDYTKVSAEKRSLRSLFRFPKDPMLRRVWIDFCGLDPKTDVRSRRLCSVHFEIEDTTLKRGSVVHRKRDAIPTIRTADDFDFSDLPIESDKQVPSETVDDEWFLVPRKRKAKSPEPSTSATVESPGDVPPYLLDIGDILQKYAAPKSITIIHDINSHTVTISYQPIFNPVAPKKQRTICSRCNAIFRKPTDLQMHEKICRDKLNPYGCATCNATFKSTAELRKHTCNSNPEISICQAGKPPKRNEKTMFNNISTERESLELLSQEITGEKYDSDSDGVDVSDEVHPNKQCPHCSRFIPVSKMSKHFAKFHQDENSPFPCRICLLSLESCAELSKHLKSHTLEQLHDLKEQHPDGLRYTCNKRECFECYLCGNVFKTGESCKKHQDCHLLPWVRCPVCQRMFNLKDELVRHLKKHLGNSRA